MTLQLTLQKGEFAITGKQVTFEAPCESAGLTKLLIQGKTYDLVDSIGNPIVANAFVKGAMVSVILNNETSKAFIQNPNSTKYLDAKLQGALNPTFVEAEKLETIKSGESLPDLFGKIARLFTAFQNGGNGTSTNLDFTISAISLDADSEPTVTKTTNEDGSINFTFGIPSGGSSEPSAYYIDLTKVVEVDSDPRDSNGNTIKDLTRAQGFDVSSYVRESEVLSQTGQILIKYKDIRFPDDTITAEVTAKKYDPTDSSAVLVLYATPLNPWNERGSAIKLTISKKSANSYSSYLVYRPGIEDADKVETYSLNFANWNGGSFTETLEDGTVKTHDVTLVSGIPTKISGITISGVS